MGLKIVMCSYIAIYKIRLTAMGLGGGWEVLSELENVNDLEFNSRP